MKRCASCGHPGCEELIDFGDLPVCHHFVMADEREERYPAALGCCRRCGLVQLINPPAPAQLVPRFDWIVYNEPERHLDALTELLVRLPGVSPESGVAGLSFNDDSLLGRLRDRGYARTWRPDMMSDLHLDRRNAGIESIQARIQPPLAANLRRRYGAPDILVVRMMLEHSQSPGQFLHEVRGLVGPSGYVVFEVPDCARALEVLDYTVIWEDHSLYFTASTFQDTLRRHGFEIVRFSCYPSAHENCLVAITRVSREIAGDQPAGAEQETESARANRFAAEFLPRRNAVRRQIEDWRKAGRIVMFGAGHHSVMFLNLMRVGDLIDCVIDDHPHKRGRLMPGSRLAIVESSRLAEPDIQVCLLSLSVESESKVMKRHEPFAQRGGIFASIFPGSAGGLFRVVTAGSRRPGLNPVQP